MKIIRPEMLLSILIIMLALSATSIGAQSKVPVQFPNPDLKGAFGDNHGKIGSASPPTERVRSPDDLVKILKSDFTGRVIIPADRHWNLDGYSEIPLHSGISLIGERGPLGSRPLLYTTKKKESYSLFGVRGNDVYVGGIHFRGPAAGSRKSSQPYVHAIEIEEDPEQKYGRRVLIVDNEFEEWTGSGVSVRGVHQVDTPAQWNPSWPRIQAKEANLVRVERNYFHHNARDGGGYGVYLNGAAYVTVNGNVFDFNRHAVAATGRAYSGYIARFNYVLQGGFKQDGFYNQHFDVHGRKDGGYGGPAGDYFEIANNTIRGDQKYSILKTRPAFMLRGKPLAGAHFNNNLLLHDNLDAAVSLKMSKLSIGIGEDHKKFNFHATGNRFKTDYSTECATGDFDGDGRTDVFLANGTAWFFSRAGIRPWEFLHASDKRTQELGFADIDNDGSTDVLYRAINGDLGYLKSGSVALKDLTRVPVPIQELRYGDFDGDGKTDIFYTKDGQWRIWFGSTRTWSTVRGSGIQIGELLFGEFDNMRGTDVAAVANGAWSIYSGGRGAWDRLNAKLRSSFANAVVADFDGNGRSDIAFSDGQKWVYSRDGRFPLKVIRDGKPSPAYAPLKKLMIGTFDSSKGSKVVSFEVKRNLAASPFDPPRFVLAERFVIWDGLDKSPLFRVRSEQNMR